MPQRRCGVVCGYIWVSVWVGGFVCMCAHTQIGRISKVHKSVHTSMYAWGCNSLTCHQQTLGRHRVVESHCAICPIKMVFLPHQGQEPLAIFLWELSAGRLSSKPRSFCFCETSTLLYSSVIRKPGLLWDKNIWLFNPVGLIYMCCLFIFSLVMKISGSHGAKSHI